MLRRTFIGILLLGTLLCAAVGVQSGEKKWSPITVRWYGQSFFVVESSKGFKVAFDPHLIPEFGRPVGVKADVVLISHNHTDHTPSRRSTTPRTRACASSAA